MNPNRSTLLAAALTAANIMNPAIESPVGFQVRGPEHVTDLDRQWSLAVNSATLAVGSSVEMSAIPETGECVVEPLFRANLQNEHYRNLDPFYEKVCWTLGIPVLGSKEVSDESILEHSETIKRVLSPYPIIVARLQEKGFRVGVIGTHQKATELPEYRRLPYEYPDTDWTYARAYGATIKRPLMAVPEESTATQACSPVNKYQKQLVSVHELGHSILDLAVTPYDNGATIDKLKILFVTAKNNPDYLNTYALHSMKEYWAEGVQDFFNASHKVVRSNGGGDGLEGPIHNSQTLLKADPGLHALISKVFTDGDTLGADLSCSVTR